MNKKQYINIAKNSAKIQISELKKIKKIFNKSFIKAVDLILNCKGKVILAGIGKSGLIAKKISATFSSIGIPSFFTLASCTVIWVKLKKKIFWLFSPTQEILLS